MLKYPDFTPSPRSVDTHGGLLINVFFGGSVWDFSEPYQIARRLVGAKIGKTFSGALETSLPANCAESAQIPGFRGSRGLQNTNLYWSYLVDLFWPYQNALKCA